MKILKSISGKEAIIDAKYFEFLSQFPWDAHPRGYFMCSSSGTWNGWELQHKLLHHFIIKLLGHKVPKGKIIDHVDKDTFNNQRLNLRIITQQGNCCNAKMRINNTSGISGVHWDKVRHKWVASIKISDKNIFLGRFNSKKDASEARLVADKKRNLELFGNESNCINMNPLKDLGLPDLSIRLRTCRDRPVGRSGIRGVQMVTGLKNPYSSSIRINGKKKFLGYFKTPKEASDAYEQILSEISS